MFFKFRCAIIAFFIFFFSFFAFISMSYGSKPPLSVSSNYQNSNVNAGNFKKTGQLYGLSAKIIGSITYKIPPSVSFHDIKNSLFIKKGEYFSMSGLEKTIKSLYATGYFSNIKVFSKIKGRFIFLRFFLLQKVFIKEINIHGLNNSSIDKNYLLKSIPLKAGGLLMNSYKTGTIGQIKKILVRSGYSDAAVSISDYVLRKLRKYIVNIYITLHKPILISKVFIKWRTYYPEKRLKTMLKTITGRPLNRLVISNFRKRLQRLYISKGFLSPIIGFPRIKYISKYKCILLFDIHPGYRIFFHFEGIKPYTPDFIETNVLNIQEVFVFNKETFLLFKNVIRDFFRKNGYYFNRVSFSERKNKKKRTIDLYYGIIKGSKVTVKNIILKGNMPFSRSKIFSFMKTHPSAFFSPQYFFKKRLSNDIANIVNFYNNEGYLSAKVSSKLSFSKDKKSVVIFISIKKGIRTYVKHILLSGLPPKVKKIVAGHFKSMLNKPFRIIKANEDKSRISTAEVNYGYVFSTVRLKTAYTKDKSGVDLYYIVKSGPQVVIKKIFVSGNTITKTSYIRSLILFKPAQIYNQAEIIKTQNDMYKTGIFNSVNIALQNPKREKKFKNIIVKVKDARPVSLSFGAGYGTYTRYRGFIQVDDDNLFGSGKSLLMRFSKSAIYTTILFSYYDPAIYNYRGLSFNANGLDSDIITLNYTLHKEGTSFSLIRKFNNHLHGLISYSMFYNVLSGLNQGAEITPRDTGFTRVSAVGVAMIYDTRNNIFNPVSGDLTSLKLTYSSFMIESQINFARLFFHTEEFIPFIYNTVFEYSLRLGYIKPLAPTTQVPINERFFLGGRTTVRGFPQDSIGVMNSYGYPVGGDIMENYNLQLNIPVYKNFNFFIFQDGGNVFLTPSDIRPLALYKSAGAGIMYISPIGPISVSYGYILTKEPYWPIGGINFTIGTSF